MSETFAFEISRVAEPDYLTLATQLLEPEVFNYVGLKHHGIVTLYYGKALEKYRIITRAHQAKWTISRLEKDRISANFQGNPLWPKIALETFSGLSDYFGLSATSTEDCCLIPLSETVNHQLKTLYSHIHLRSGMNWRFRDLNLYKQERRELLTDRLYVDIFIDHGQLPMAPITTRDSVHDWSYHFVTLLFDEFLENLRLTLKVIRGHLSHFTGETQYHWNYYGHSLDPTGNIKGHTVGEKMTYDQAIYRQMAISLDVTTAKLIQILLLHKKGMIDRCQSEIRWMETYLRGVSFESIQKILPFECHLEEKIELPANLGIHLNSGLMDYCFEKLRQLNELAESLKNAELILYRKQVFEQLLSNHCLFLG